MYSVVFVWCQNSVIVMVSSHFSFIIRIIMLIIVNIWSYTPQYYFSTSNRFNQYSSILISTSRLSISIAFHSLVQVESPISIAVHSLYQKSHQYNIVLLGISSTLIITSSPLISVQCCIYAVLEQCQNSVGILLVQYLQ